MLSAWHVVTSMTTGGSQSYRGLLWVTCDPLLRFDEHSSDFSIQNSYSWLKILKVKVSISWCYFAIVTVKSTKGKYVEKSYESTGYRLRKDLEIFMVISKKAADAIQRELDEGIESSKTPVYDKILTWTAVGLQGSLLSHFLEPIYLTGILVPSATRAKKLYTSLKSKWENVELFDSTDGFHFNPANVYGVKTPRNGNSRRRTSSIFASSDRSVCLNWIRGMDPPSEVLYSDTGSSTTGHGSRLSKQELFDCFARLSFGREFPTLSWSPFRPIYPLNYAKVKSQAIPYNTIKCHLYHTSAITSDNNNNNRSDESEELPKLSLMTDTKSLSDNFNAFDPK